MVELGKPGDAPERDAVDVRVEDRAACRMVLAIALIAVMGIVALIDGAVMDCNRPADAPTAAELPSDL